MKSPAAPTLQQERSSDSLRGSLRDTRRRRDAGQFERGRILGLDVNDADAMGVGVSHIQLAIGNTKTGGLIERSIRQPAIGALAAKPCLAFAFGRLDGFDFAVIS